MRASFSLISALVLVACSSASAPPPPASSASAAPAASGAPAAHHWGYSGDEGPSHWGELCAAGKEQSPVAIPANLPADANAALSNVHLAPVPLRIVHNGHSIQVDDTAPSSVTFQGTTYDLAQFHFHAPSEHTIGGAKFDAEVHFVHKSKDGKLLVLAVMLRSGAENAALKPLWDAMPTTPTKEPIVVAGQTIDVQSLFPKGNRFAHYEGSLTVPPCTEPVQWFVALPDEAGALEVPAAAIAKLHAALGETSNRPVQALNGRAPTLVVAR